MKRAIRIVLTALAMAAGSAAQAQLAFNTTFDSSVDTNFGANAAAFKADFAYAESLFTSNFSDPIHVNITVQGAAGTSILGQSSTFLTSYGYTAERAHLLTDAKTADDLTSVGVNGSFSATAPSSQAWWVTSAQAKALGLAADNNSTDGTITLGAGFNYAFDPNNRAVAGDFDIIGVMMHEISEVMGRIGFPSGTVIGGSGADMLTDALSYTGPGTRDLTGGPGRSFSIDSGTTLLKAFNDSGNGGDAFDWASGTLDSFNAFSDPGVKNDLTDVDLRIVDVLGYDRVAAVPLPASAWLLLSGLAGLVLVSRRRTAADFS